MAVKINVCVGSSCGGKGGTSLVRDIEEMCQGRALVDPGQCLGKCANGPNVEYVIGTTSKVTTKVNNYKKAVELVKDAVEDIEIRGVMQKVGKVKWVSRREESGEVRQQKVAEAIKLVGKDEQTASKKEPLIMSELFVLRSKEMVKARKFDLALQDAEKALKLQPEWAQALIAQSAALEGLGWNGKAVEALEQALKINRGIGAEKSSLIRIKARIDRKVQEGGPIGVGANGKRPDEAPAPAAAPAEGDDSAAAPDATAKPKAKAKKKAAPKDAAPAAEKGGTKSKDAKPGRQSKLVGKDGKEVPSTTTKTKPDAPQDAPPAIAEAKEALAKAAVEVEADLGDMPHQDWRIDEVKHINHDCITMLLSCGKVGALAKYPAVGDVWHIDLLAEIGDGEVVRAYTPVSSQDDYYRGSLELMVKVYPDGKLTQHLAKLVPGDNILVSAPLSTLVPQDYVEGMTLIAGGTAVTLALQVCNAVLRLSSPGTAEAPPVHAFLCNRTDADALYQDRFDQLQATYPSLRVVHCLSQGSPPETKSGRAEWHKGRVDSTILVTAEPLKSVVSGPPGLLKTALSLLTKLGRSRENVEVVDELAEVDEAEALEAKVEYPIKAWCSVGPNGKPCGGGAEGPLCSGMVHLEQIDAETCKISYEITGLEPGKHGFHIHEKSDFSNGCLSAGPHYNPHGKVHGGPGDGERHAGDLGNVEPGADGVARGEITDSLIKLHGQFSVMGRSFMVHADPDDLGQGDHSEPGTNGKTSQTTGNAGARIACGEISAGEYVPPQASAAMQNAPMQYVAPAPIATPAAVELAGHLTQADRAAAADLEPPPQRSWLGCGLFGVCRPARRRAPSPDCEEGAMPVIADE